MKIYCLLVSSLRLSDRILNRIYLTACQMIKHNNSRRRLLDDDADGLIQTEGEHYCIGTIAGILFRGEIDTVKGTTKISFLLRDDDILDNLEGCEWTPINSENSPQESFRWN